MTSVENPIGPPKEFLEALSSAKEAEFRGELKVSETSAPSGLAPFQSAWAADVDPTNLGKNRDLGTGRLVFLYDPDCPETWDSAFRMVAFAQAPIEVQMGQDEFLPEVAWSWLIDALDSRVLNYLHIAGTTTAVVSRGFGEMSSDSSGAQIEVRASWSPVSAEIKPHLEAWSEFICMLAGIPPTHAGVATLSPHRNNS